MSAHVLWICLIAAAGFTPDGGQTDRIASALPKARALMDAGQAREAVAALEALNLSDEPRVAHLLGVAAYHADDFTRAIDLLSPLPSRFEEGSPERREVVQVLGLSLFLAGRLADAVPHLESTRRWAPNNLELAHILGQAYVQIGRLDEARAQFAQAFGVAPGSAGAHLVTAQMMIRGEPGGRGAEARAREGRETASGQPAARPARALPGPVRRVHRAHAP
jgi:Flp pilus assembly protein TadD